MSTWQELAKAKRESILAAIPQKWRLSAIPSAEEQQDVTGKYIQQFLTEREIEITETDAVGIVSKTTTGAWKAREVTEAFCHRAALAHQLVSCLHEIFFDAAIADAQKLDDYYAQHNAPVGPLHGLPVSLKDQFHVRGVETTMGYLGWIDTFEGLKGTGKERVFESEMVRELRALGAVLYVKTAVPHTLMLGETTNNIIGYCWNPKNRHLSSGGSSGGEGALLALRGSPLGFGTDIGGSIRIPSAFNGLYGIRPSAGRMPYAGMANSMQGQNSILSVVGPMAASAGALRLAMQSILAQQPWLHDPLVHEIPWRSEQEDAVRRLLDTSAGGRQLAFGVLRHDGAVRPNPPVRRALDIVVATIEKLGHRVIEWTPPPHARGTALANEAFVFDGGADIHQALGLAGEPMDPALVGAYGTAPGREYSASEIARVNIALREFRAEYAAYWASTAALTGTGEPADAFIMPVAPFPAARRGGYPNYGYSTVLNALDYSACVIPVTVADAGVDVADAKFESLCGAKGDKAAFEGYDAELYDGAFVGVQVVGRRLQEEKVLVLAEAVGAAIRGTAA